MKLELALLVWSVALAFVQMLVAATPRRCRWGFPSSRETATTCRR